MGPTTTTIEAAAEAAYEMNRRFCELVELNGDPSRPPWSEAPPWQVETNIAGVWAIVDNPELSSRESHDLWLEHKLAEGWKYGPTRDVENKEHPCMVAYDELPAAQLAKDVIFGAVVRAVLGLQPCQP